MFTSRIFFFPSFLSWWRQGAVECWVPGHPTGTNEADIIICAYLVPRGLSVTTWDGREASGQGCWRR